MNEAGEIEAERRVPTDNLGEIAEEYAGSKAAIEATSNYYHVYEMLSEHLEVQVAVEWLVVQAVDVYRFFLSEDVDRWRPEDILRIAWMAEVAEFP